MAVDIDLPDLSDARCRRDIGVGRLNAAVAYVVGVSTFMFTLRLTAEINAIMFFASYLVIPSCLTLGMLMERRFQFGKLVQASLIIALLKFVTTLGLHLMQKQILAILGS